MEIGITQLIALLTAHFIGDFALQSNQMALNKSKSNYWLFVHVLIYSVTLFVFVVFLGLKNVGIFVGINFLLHFVTDYFTSRLTTKLWLAERRHGFFVAIGFDQLIHSFCLILTFAYFT